MKKRKEISYLLDRYLSSRYEGKDTYFDADEIDDLLDSFEESDDFTYYDEVLALGLRLHPGNPDLQVRLCKSYLYNEAYDQALALIDSIGESDNEELDMLRLECYAMQHAYDKIIGYIEQLIIGECEYVETLFEYVAPILSDVEMTKEAHDFINRGLLLFPDNLILKDELCYNLEIEGDIKKAIEVCNELIDQNPYSNDFWFTLGRLYSINGDYEKAIEAFDFALTCDDSDDELKVLKAYCLFMNENYEKAIEVYNDIETDEETHKRIVPLLAECYLKLENYEKAYSLLKELMKSNDQPEDSSTYICYIRCCAETGREEEAYEVLLQASELFPKNIRILSLLALTYLDKGDEEKAMETTERLFNALDQVENKRQEDFENLYRAGQYLFVKGDTDKALQYYQKVLESNPKMPYVHLHMAIAYLAKGDMKHFHEHYRQASPEELLDYLKNAGLSYEKITEPFNVRQIPPEDLVKEFLQNKDNKN